MVSRPTPASVQRSRASQRPSASANGGPLRFPTPRTPDGYPTPYGLRETMRTALGQSRVPGNVAHTPRARLTKIVENRTLCSVELSEGSPLSTGLQVGSRTGAHTLGGGFPVPRFRLWVGSQFPIATFPALAASNGACGFPALRFPVRFVSRVMGPIMLGALSASVVGAAPVVLKQTQVRIQPLPTPPLPAEAPPFSCTHQCRRTFFSTNL